MHALRSRNALFTVEKFAGHYGENMSYCRFGPESDVYCYHSASCGGFFTATKDHEIHHDRTSLQAAARLERLIEEGFLVPKTAIAQLLKEAIQRWDNPEQERAAERERCALQMERLGHHEVAHCLRTYTG